MRSGQGQQQQHCCGLWHCLAACPGGAQWALAPGEGVQCLPIKVITLPPEQASLSASCSSQIPLLPHPEKGQGHQDSRRLCHCNRLSITLPSCSGSGIHRHQHQHQTLANVEWRGGEVAENKRRPKQKATRPVGGSLERWLAPPARSAPGCRKFALTFITIIHNSLKHLCGCRPSLLRQTCP